MMKMMAVNTRLATLFLLFVCIVEIGYSQILNAGTADSLKLILGQNTFTCVEEEIDLYIDIAKYETNSHEKIVYAQKALDLAKSNDNARSEARAKFLIGQTYSVQGDIDKALEILYDCLRLYKNLGREIGIANVKFELGSIYHREGRYRNALRNFKDAYKLYSLKDNAIGQASALSNIGETFRYLNDFDSALYYFSLSYQAYDAIDYVLGRAYSLGNIGLVYAEINQNDSAENYIRQASEMLEELGDRYPIAVYQTYMADIYKDKGDWNAALGYAHSSLQISEEEGLKEQIRDASLKLSELYHENGDFQRAFGYQSQYIAYRDSINNEDIIRKMADLRMEYEMSKKQVEVDLLQQKRKNQQLIIIGLSIISVLIGILAILTYRNNLARRKTNRLLHKNKEEIEEQRDKLESLNGMKDKFFGIISHDLRTPVNSLQGIAHLLKHHANSKNTEEVDQLTDLVDKSINTLSTLLDNLLNWALTQQGALPYHPQKVALKPVINNALDIFKNAAEAKSIQLKSEVSDDAIAFVDEDSIHSLLRNVINNAVKFTLKKGEVFVTAFRNGEKVEIVISDTGTGMDEYQLKNLFKIDKKKVSKGTSGEKGSGLGMLLCNEIVKLNNGKIRAESEFSKGTKIFIELPAARFS